MRFALRPLLMAAALLLPLPGLAATPADLVAERAHDLWAPQLPEGATIRVRLVDGAPEAADVLSAFWMDRDSGRFLANAVTPDGHVRRIEGVAMVTLMVPVPVRRLMPGDIVRPEDVQTVELPAGRVGSFTVTSPDKLIGMEVKRMLAQGRQVMLQSITAPLVVGRGDRVSILYDDGGLVLTAPGRALDDAHEGQELRIVNLVSNKSLRGIAVQDGVVEVIR